MLTLRNNTTTILTALERNVVTLIAPAYRVTDEHSYAVGMVLLDMCQSAVRLLPAFWVENGNESEADSSRNDRLAESLAFLYFSVRFNVKVDIGLAIRTGPPEEIARETVRRHIAVRAVDGQDTTAAAIALGRWVYGLRDGALQNHAYRGAGLPVAAFASLQLSREVGTRSHTQRVKNSQSPRPDGRSLRR